MVKLRIHDTGRPTSVEPEVAKFLVAGSRYDLLIWTAEEWERIPWEQRPDDACLGSRGNWYLFDAPAAGPGGSRPAPVADEVRICLVGRWHALRYWTPEAWTRLEPGDRPGLAIFGDAGGWFFIEPV